MLRLTLSGGSGGSGGHTVARSAATAGPSAPAGAGAGTAAGRVQPATQPVARGALARLDALGHTRIRQLAQLGLPVYCGGHRGHDVAFTFDDGPGPYTALALRKLTQAHERATFFVVGKSMNQYPGYLPRELKLAALGDHTYTHPDLVALPTAQVQSEIERAKLQIERESGRPVDLFRPPYGATNASVTQTARRLGLLPIMWTADSADSLGANYAGIIRNVAAALHPGAIILMHENHGQTIRALTTILPLLHQRHLRSVSLPELFATNPPSVAQLRKGAAGCGGASGAAFRVGSG